MQIKELISSWRLCAPKGMYLFKHPFLYQQFNTKNKETAA